MPGDFKCLHFLPWDTTSNDCIYVSQRRISMALWSNTPQPPHPPSLLVPLLHIQAISASPWRWRQYLSGTSDIKGLAGDPPSDLGRGARSRDHNIASLCLSADQCQMMGMKKKTHRPLHCYFHSGYCSTRKTTQARATVNTLTRARIQYRYWICGIMHLKLPQSHLQP